MRIDGRNLRLLLLLPVVVLFIGTTGFMILEKLSFLDALYFTIVTISTVGYGDIHPTNVASKAFGIVLIIIGIGTFFTIITNVTQLLVQRGQDRLRKQRLNMLVGVFFTEAGNELLRLFAQYDPGIDGIRKNFLFNENWSENDYAHLRKQLRHHEYAIDSKLMDLEKLRSFLGEKGDLLVRQIENPDLMEKESYTDLLWAVVHLRDELMSRNSLSDLPESDLAHLANDAARAYGVLVGQWTHYLQHLKRSYPYLFSLVLRTNPFSESPSAIVK